MHTSERAIISIPSRKENGDLSTLKGRKIHCHLLHRSIGRRIHRDQSEVHGSINLKFHLGIVVLKICLLSFY